MTVKQLKRGTWFTLKPIPYPEESQVYIRGDYDRECKKYACQKWDDINEYKLFRGDREVYTDFIF